MGRGQHRAVPGVAVVALSGVLAGGASLAPGVADAAPARPAPPPECVIGTTTYTQQPAPGRRLVEALGAAKKCVDAINDHLLDRDDLVAYGLRPAKPVAAATPTTPSPTTTAQPKPSTPPPTTTTTTPAVPGKTTTVPPVVPGKTTTVPPATGSESDPTSTTPKAPVGSADGSPGGPVGEPDPARPRPEGGESAGAPSSPALRAAAPQALPVAAPVAPVASPPAAPEAPGALPAITDAPVGDAIPLDSPLLDPVMPAALLEPLGAPGLASLPGETAPLQTLGGDVSAVTTSSQVQALGLDGLQRGAGLPAVLGVTILSGLGGFALRHRILARIRSSTAGAPDPDDLDDLDDLDHRGGRHSA